MNQLSAVIAATSPAMTLEKRFNMIETLSEHAIRGNAK
jgi:hypothetical protein